jgi:hypothetical protein
VPEFRNSVKGNLPLKVVHTFPSRNNPVLIKLRKVLREARSVARVHEVVIFPRAGADINENLGRKAVDPDAVKAWACSICVTSVNVRTTPLVTFSIVR